MDGRGRDGTPPELDDLRLGELLYSGTGESCLPCHRSTRNAEATTVVLSEAQGEVWEICAFFGHQITGNLWSALSCAEDEEFSVGEGMRLN